MEYRILGQSGLRVSVMGLGTNALGGRAAEDVSREIVLTAIDRGVTLIDTANIYTSGQSESILGRVLEGRRHEVVLATKAGMAAGEGPYRRGASRRHLLAEVEASLRRLCTDYIDLFQVHAFDPATPLEETLRTLEDLVRSGKVRYVGASNYRAWQLMKALAVSERRGWERYASVQPSYSLADRTVEAELVPLCLDQQVGIIAYFPLAGGLLTGKYHANAAPPPDSRAAVNPRFGSRLLESQQNLDLAAEVAAVARSLEVSPAQVALAWLLARPAVASAIAGATRPSQVMENLGALDVHLDPTTTARLDEASRPFLRRRFMEPETP